MEDHEAQLSVAVSEKPSSEHDDSLSNDGKDDGSMSPSSNGGDGIRKSIYNLASTRKEIPVSHSKFLWFKVRSKERATLLFSLSFFFLLSIFALLFIAVEYKAEQERNLEYINLMTRLKTIVQDNNPEIYEEVRDFIGIDDKVGTQHFVKFDEESGQWEPWELQSFSSAFYYAFALATTIGYGDIVTHTMEGKLLTIVAICVTLPVAIVTYTRLASSLSNKAMQLLLKRSDQFKALLHKYDKDRSGKLDYHELKLCFHDLGLALTNDEVRKVIAEFDEDKDNVLSIDEFCAAATALNVNAGKLARQLLQLRFAVFTLITFTIVFVVAFYFLSNLGAVDSVYFTVVTITTVGLGDITLDPAARAPLTIPVFLLLGLVALVIQSVTELMTTEDEDPEQEKDN